MTIDCAIIGGGPAGLNAALVLGRARRKVLLFDDNNARNAVTQHSHGSITRDGVTPAEFRAISACPIARYPSVQALTTRIASVSRQACTIGQDLGCETDEQGSVVTDELGRTTIKDLYAAGDAVNITKNQLTWAAASGSRAAIGVNTDLTGRFLTSRRLELLCLIRLYRTEN